MDFNEYSYLCHHGIQGMKWGVRRYQNKDGTLTAEGRERYNKAASAAHKVHITAKNKEPEITKAVKSAGIPLYGIEHRLKTEQSIRRKILKGVDEEFMSIDDSASDIKDAVRYTTISSEKNFVDNYNKFKNKMEENGYEEIRCKNNFELYKEGKVKHKSVQSVFEDRDGYKFEVQFQTPASQKAKDLKTPLYEERRKVGISETKAKMLERKMIDLAEAVKDPDRIDEIKTYKK